MARIISISGLISSGKDTIAEYLINNYGFKKDSFAATLKDAVAAMFGWDRTMLEGATPETRALREQVDQWWAKRLGIPHLTPRWVLQYYGTEVVRRHLHDDFWLATLEKRLAETTDDIVITDSRFPNELSMLRISGAVLMQVDRGEYPAWWYTAVAGNNGDNAAYETMVLQSAVHPSEWSWVGLPMDFIIKNNSTKEDLYYTTKSLLGL